MCSNMNAIFVVSATIYCLGIIISSYYCLGSQHLIEFVEEWGCYDSEIRLTCGHLDSKIAILEATFTPNCTEEECIKGDLKRLMRGHSHSKKLSLRSAETEAARKFLETLRQSDISNSNAELVDSEQHYQHHHHHHNQENSESIPQANYLIGAKHKRASLRGSLERLIIKYLRQISPSENFEEFGKRLKRFRRELLSLSDTETPTESEVSNRDNLKSERTILGSRNVSFEDYEMQDRAAVGSSSEERYRKYYETRNYCAEQRRKIGTLSRLELDESLKRINDTRQNIRKILNKRCSGKNHCSFLFAADDPLAVLWDSGLVNVKYVCMDDYHTNHYCNEHLTIGYDSSPKRRQVSEDHVKGEPRAEARVQQRDQVFHSVKILKSNVDDVEDVPEEIEKVVPERKKLSENMQKVRKKEKGIYSQDFKVLKILPSNLDDFNDIEEIGDEIYFRTDDTSVTKDIFPSVLVPTSLTLASEASPHQESRLPLPRSTNGYPYSLDNSNKGSGNENHTSDLSKFENITMLIREGEQYFVTYPSPRILDSIVSRETTTTATKLKSTTTTTMTATTTPIPPASTITANATTTVSATSSLLLSSSSILTTPSSILLLSPSSTMPPSALVASTISSTNPPPLLPPSTEGLPPASGASSMTFVESATIDTRFDSEMLSREQLEEIQTTNEQDIEMAVPTVGELSMEASGRHYTTVFSAGDESRINGVRTGDRDNGDVDSENDNDDEGFDDYSEEGYDGVTTRRQYKSIQRTYYGPPKPQGFTMTPGYPKFYIGDCECMWKILAPVAQRIRLTILDISLRYEKNCQDYLQIVDLKTGKTLFKSCEEPNWPTEIVSSSNQVEIIVKAKTKFAYPKRGVLIHYSALGCLTPPPPMHGRFVERTEELARYECEASFVFPDSAISTRQLRCTDQHAWNATLPDCVEEDAVSGSGLDSGLDFNLQKTESSTSAKMGHSETDTVFDIIIPSILIVGLFVINAVIFLIIMKQRKRSANRMDVEAKELAEL